MVPSRAAKFASVSTQLNKKKLFTNLKDKLNFKVRSSIKTILNRQNKLFNSRTLYSDRLKKMKEKQAFFQVFFNQ